jgi:predicted MFS family arabinose efflux permease
MLASLRCPAVFMLLLSALLFFCGYSGVFFYLKRFGAVRGMANAGLFFTIATVIMILARLFGGWLFDRCNKVALCVAALLAVTVSYALLPLCASSRELFLLAGLSGLGWGIAMPLQAAIMFDVSTPQARGLNQNLLIVMMQAGFFLGPLLGGWTISLCGYAVLFASLAAATFASLIMMALVWRYTTLTAAASGAIP